MTRHPDNTAQIEVECSETNGAFTPGTPVSPLRNWLDRAVSLLLLSLIFVQPFCFGGVHPPAFYLACLLTLLLAGVYLLSSSSELQILSQNKTLYTCLSAFALLLGAALLLPIYRGVDIHPVLGKRPGLPDVFLARDYFLSFMSFSAVLLLTSLWLNRSSRRQETLPTWLCLLALLTGLTALSHWFYDNGLLFWTFEPDYVFISPRARWPFVNADHLAAFLLPGSFLLAGRLAYRLYQHRLSGHTDTLSRLASSRRSQTHLIGAAFNAFSLAVVLVAIAGSLSRGAWIGLAIGVLIFYFCLRAIGLKAPEQRSRTQDNPYLRETASSNSPRHRRKRRSAHNSEWKFSLNSSLIRLLVLVFVLLLVAMFLGARGTEMLMQRIDFGLMYSKDDIRWQMYSDTLRMIADHPLLGVGPGGWAAVFPAYMDRLLSGINPVYLHSNPLQLLAETGLLGFLTLITAAAYVVSTAIKAVRSAELSAKVRIKTAAVLAGIAALMTASCFDFPLSIPAISSALAIYLALLLRYSNQGLQNRRSGSAGAEPLTEEVA